MFQLSTQCCRVFRRPILSARRRAFTLIELCIGLVVMALVMGAVASFTLALSMSWQQGETTQKLMLTSNQVSVQLQNVVRNARYFGFNNGSLLSSLLGAQPQIKIWKDDDVVSNGRVEYGEIVVLEYDTGTKQLLLWEMSETNPNYAKSYLTLFFLTDGLLPDFKLGMDPKVLAENVEAAEFTLDNGGTNTLPIFRYKLWLNRTNTEKPWLSDEDSIVVQPGTVTIRTPQMPS